MQLGAIFEAWYDIAMKGPCDDVMRLRAGCITEYVDSNMHIQFSYMMLNRNYQKFNAG